MAARAVVLLTLLVPLAGCGATLEAADPAADVRPIPTGEGCAATVMTTLGSVLKRVYREGIVSERTASARHMITRSVPLRKAVERGDASAARAAIKELIATGHMSDVMIVKNKKVLVAVGGPALAPLRGTLMDASGHELAGYVVSVWADNGFVSEANGIAQGTVALRVGEASIAGIDLPPGLAAQGTLTRNGASFHYTSFPVQTYPAGSATLYLLKPLSAIEKLCGASSEDTIVNTLKGIAELIYAGESGARTHVQIKRVQSDAPLLRAVSRGDAAATETAVKALLHEHIVRLRVSGKGHLLSDVGGPYVLAPVTAPLRLGRRTIGSFVLSIQDDEGYLRLTKRLAGLQVLMYMNPIGPANRGGLQLVKNSLGPNPGAVPASGRYRYRGANYRVFTVDAKAFPSGPLTIRVLVPIPYT